ncbi:hypothetical protein B296_00049901 [Ensete ventricosum]|uniref:Uncharacterized protein n=1 Tax=Ensete ventricosum TaxID=4639 RepID=A0A426X8Q9_ENSVE|nr:hypothetical protein B296_00049901 [Ensete ventricosum]
MVNRARWGKSDLCHKQRQVGCKCKLARKLLEPLMRSAAVNKTSMKLDTLRKRRRNLVCQLGKRSHKERLSTMETRLDVREATLEELYQGQGRLLGVESSQEEAESRIDRVESLVDRLTEDTKDSDMIRASIGQGQMTMPGKLNMRPAPTTENKSKVQASDFRQAKVDKHDDIEEHNDDAEDEDEDDDWDAFQSFPANTASVSAIDSRDGKTISEPAPCDEPSTVNNHQLNRNNGHDHDLFQPNVCEEDNDAQDVSPGQAKEMTSLKMEEFEEDSSIRYSNELVAEDSSDRSQDLYHESSEVNEDGTSTVHNSLPSTVLGRDEEPTKKEGKAVQLEVEATDKARDVCIEMHHDAMPADSEDTDRNNSSQHQFHEGEVQSVCLDHGDDSNESFNDVLIAQDDNQKEADGPNSSLESRGEIQKHY